MRGHVLTPFHQAAARMAGRGQIIKANVLTTNLPYASHCASVLSHTLFIIPREAGTMFMPFLQVS